ncbi:MAG: Multidrug resistance protein MdtA [Gemmatimonadaceae bacterium]|nr:Multidrug resistance protein MdtA [Gemmatimonadaceae bacterium]
MTIRVAPASRLSYEPYMRRTITFSIAAVVAVAAAFWFFNRADARGLTSFRLVEVDRGTIEATVASTGKLRAVTTVQVGTQVSGQVSAIYVDFNDRVKKGQLIARIDPTLAEQAVRDAEANLERNNAELANAQRDFDRNKQLYDRKVLTESEYSAALYRLEVAKANLKSAEVTVERARKNLAYTSIYAPIDGIVVERNVDVGQTVAASLSAPQLFLIANDLSEMWILASVDESDIGLIAEGQPVRFTVQAYPTRTFTGKVKQVRLQSTVQENVVNYTVVIDCANSDGKLLPGMTATVDFLVGTATDVFRVPNAALRFRPTAVEIAKLGDANSAASIGGVDSGTRQPADTTRGATADSARGRSADSTQHTRGGSTGSAPGASARTGTRSGGTAQLWYLDAQGKLASIRVRTGVTDGKVTEIRGTDLKVGMQVISGIVAATATSTNPFQQQQQGGPGGPPRF